VDSADRDRVYRHVFLREHQPSFVSTASLPPRSESGPFRGVASLHQKMWSLCGLLHVKFFPVSCLAGYLAFAVGSALGAALGSDCFLHVCPGRELGRMASDLHPFADWRHPRCHIGQFRGVDGTGSDISFSELEIATNEHCRRLNPHRATQYIASYFVTTHSPSLFSSVTENSSL
jgi:hypothetical protein